MEQAPKRRKTSVAFWKQGSFYLKEEDPPAVHLFGKLVNNPEDPGQHQMIKEVSKQELETGLGNKLQTEIAWTTLEE